MVCSGAVCILITWEKPGRVNNAHLVALGVAGGVRNCADGGKLFVVAPVFIEVQSCALLSGFPGAPGRETYPYSQFLTFVQPPGPWLCSVCSSVLNFWGTDQSSSLKGSQAQALKGNGSQGDFDQSIVSTDVFLEGRWNSRAHAVSLLWGMEGVELSDRGPFYRELMRVLDEWTLTQGLGPRVLNYSIPSEAEDI